MTPAKAFYYCLALGDLWSAAICVQNDWPFFLGLFMAIGGIYFTHVANHIPDNLH